MKNLCKYCGNKVVEGKQFCEVCESDPNIIFIDTTDKVQLHLETCTMLNDLYHRKNNDYGDSFAKLRSELPNAILVRVYDKYSRLKTLLEGEDQLVKDETIEDTLVDLANYCIMELVERKVDNE